MTVDPTHLTLDDVLAETAAIRRLARRLLDDEHDVEDVVAHVVERVDPTRKPSWLRRIARNRAIDLRRRRMVRTAAERAAAVPEAVPSAADMAAAVESRRLLADAVLALPGREREAVWLHYYEGLTVAAAAERLGVPAATMKSRLQRALARLRDRLQGKEAEWRQGMALLLPNAPVPGVPARPWGPRLPWLLVLAVAIVLAVVRVGMRESAAPSQAPAVSLGWLRDVDEVRVQILAGRDAGRRLRYARILPTSSYGDDAVVLRWNREGTAGEDRFSVLGSDRTTMIRLGSSAVATGVAFRGHGTRLLGDRAGERLQLTLRHDADGWSAEIAHAVGGGWQAIEHVTFFHRS